jgi:hypothetical protein
MKLHHVPVLLSKSYPFDTGDIIPDRSWIARKKDLKNHSIPVAQREIKTLLIKP